MNVDRHQNEEGTHLLWGRLVSPSANAFNEVASIQQDNAHAPPYMEYIFQLRQKVGLEMPSTKCITPFNEHLQCATN